MENNSNDAAPLRPEKNNILSETLSEMNLNELIVDLKNENTWQNNDRSVKTIFKSDALTLILVGLHKNAMLNPHHANGAITVQVLEGKIHFKTDQKTTLLEKGQMIALQEKVEHSAEAMADSFFLLTKVNQPI
jgi:quercetin dioxygenase-like cupin family protein